MGLELDHLISLIETVTPLAKAVPEPVGGPLEGALETTVRILKYTQPQEVKSNKEEAKELAQDAASWAQTLTKTLGGLEANPAELASLCDQVEGMLGVLTKIQASMKLQSEQSWAQRTRNKSKDAGNIVKLKRELRSAFDEFMSQSQLRLQAGQVHLKQTLAHVASGVEVLLSVKDQDTLNKLDPVGAARWNSRAAPPACLKDTRVDILKDLLAWIRTSSSEISVFWLTGLAGTGKSTIAKSFCEQVARLDASFFLITFFISKVSDNRRDPSRILTTLVHNLASVCPGFGALVAKCLTASPDVTERSLKDQIKDLVVEPLIASQAITITSPLIIAIDALDESFGTHGMESAILVLLLASALQNMPVKLLVTSRMETDIAQMFERLPKQSLKLHEIEKATVAHDVEHILKQGFRDIEAKRSHHIKAHPWPAAAEIDTLVHRTGHLIIFATTVLKYIGDSKFPPQERLQQILNLQHGSQSASAFRPIDSLYSSILQTAAHDQDGILDNHLCLKLQRLVGALCLLMQPLTMAALASLLSIPYPELHDDIGALASVLLFSPDGIISEACSVRIFHQSFRDFALSRATEAWFFIDSAATHRLIALQCLKILNGALRQDICDIQGYLIANADVRDPVLAERLDERVPEIVKYACTYWLTHAHSADEFTAELVEELNTFTQNHLLHWIELLSLLEEIPRVIVSLPQVVKKLLHETRRDSSPKLLEASKGRELLERVAALLEDTLRTLQNYDSMLRTHALQTYQSLTATMPQCNLLKIAHSDLVSSCMVSPRARKWPKTQFVMRGHTDAVNSVVFSPEGSRIASGSSDNTVRVWDVQSGRETNRLEGHHDSVNSAAFSPDGTRIASGSSDSIVRIWNVSTGDSISKLIGHRGPVNSVAFSSQGSKIVSGSDDYTVRLWNAYTCKMISVLGRHSGPVNSVAFSPDTAKIVSGSDDSTIRIWDAITGESDLIVSFQSKYTVSVRSVIFSPDGTQIGSGHGNAHTCVWAVHTGKLVTTFEGPRVAVLSAAFSHDGTKIASSSDETVHIWDAKTGDQISHLKGHGDLVKSVSFSPDGTTIASGPDDHSIRIWDVNFTTAHQISSSVDPNQYVVHVAISPDGTKIAFKLADKAIQVWDAHTGEEISSLKGHISSAVSLAFSHDGAKIAAGDFKDIDEIMIRTWDVNTGISILELAGHDDSVASVVFSPDGTKIASGSDDGTARVWDALTGNLITIFEGHGDNVYCLAFSPDSTRIVSGSCDKTVQIWDANTSDQISCQHVRDSEGWVEAVAFSSDGTCIVSGLDDGVVRIWDAESGDSISTFQHGGDADVIFVAFSSDGRHVISTTSVDQFIWDIHEISSATKNIEDAQVHTGPSMFTELRRDILLTWSSYSGWISCLSREGSLAPIFWIPEDLRGVNFRSHGATVVMSARQGGVTLLDLSALARAVM